jgi:hypothetical protein
MESDTLKNSHFIWPTKLVTYSVFIGYARVSQHLLGTTVSFRNKSSNGSWITWYE